MGLSKFSTKDGCQVRFIDENAYHMQPHQHEELQILVPIEHANFEITWSIENSSKESKTLGPGDICIIPPFVEHEVRWIKKSHLINYYIPMAFVQEALGTEDAIIHYHFGIQDEVILTISKSLQRSCTANPEEKIKLLKAALVLIINHIYIQYESNQKAGALVNSLTQISCDKVRSAMLYMSQHLDKPLSLSEIAAQVDMSPYHFLRVFKQTMGTTPAKLHMLYRLEEARNLLSNTQKSIGDIACDLGFSSQAHLSRTFSQHFGQTPNKFRKSINNRNNI